MKDASKGLTCSLISEIVLTLLRLLEVFPHGLTGRSLRSFSISVHRFVRNRLHRLSWHVCLHCWLTLKKFNYGCPSGLYSARWVSPVEQEVSCYFSAEFVICLKKTSHWKVFFKVGLKLLADLSCCVCQLKIRNIIWNTNTFFTNRRWTVVLLIPACFSNYFFFVVHLNIAMLDPSQCHTKRPQPIRTLVCSCCTPANIIYT